MLHETYFPLPAEPLHVDEDDAVEGEPLASNGGMQQPSVPSGQQTEGNPELLIPSSHLLTKQLHCPLAVQIPVSPSRPCTILQQKVLM